MVQETIMRIPVFQEHVAALNEKDVLSGLRSDAPAGKVASTLMELPPKTEKKKLR